jgi:hypothetical protein
MPASVNHPPSVEHFLDAAQDHRLAHFSAAELAALAGALRRTRFEPAPTLRDEIELELRHREEAS